jgi:flagellar basal body-associated protein FliL
MNIMLIILVFIIVSMVAGGGIFLFLRSRNKKEFLFYIYSRDLKSITTTHGKLIKDSNNQNVFELPKYNKFIDVKSSTRYLNGKMIRELVFTKDGNFAYIHDLKLVPATKDVKGKIINEALDEEEYLKYSLSPEDKQIALYRIKEIAQRFNSGMDKTQMLTLISLGVICLIMIIATAFMGYKMYQTSQNMNEHQETLTDSTKNIDKLASTNLLVTEQLAALVTGKYNNLNLSRQLS